MSLRRLFSPLVFVALTLIFFHKLAFSSMILGRGDVYSYFYPYWAARSAALLNGHLPLWSPDVFMGVPLLANSQLGTFYPPNWLVTTLTPPNAITVSLLLHIIWAMLGVYLFTRRILRLDRTAAVLAGALFGFGGYLGGQIEHINQLQALAWMPWLFWLFHRCVTGIRTERAFTLHLRNLLLLAGALALQLLAGHPQTVFITLVGLGIYGILPSPESPAISLKRPHSLLSGRGSVVSTAIVLLLAGGTAVLLASPQLVPTLELARASNRSGGLNPQQAMAFSLNPFLIGRGMLPSYDGLLFGEYIAYSGVIGLGLAMVGLFSSRSYSSEQRKRNSISERITVVVHAPGFAFGVLLVVAFLLALGVFNPLYWILASLPGFSFFRVPARWLSLVALAAAVLAGLGLQSLKTSRPRWWVLLITFGLIGGLVAGSFLSDRMAVDVTGPALPTTRTLVGWGIGLVVLAVGMLGAGKLRGRWALYALPVLAAAAVAELFFASQIMTYNEVVPDDIYSAPRFEISQLQTYGAEQIPAARLLSISPLEFDPGDAEALKARYDGLGMSALATRIALVDTKLREVIGPNLGLVWGIPSIDGFDGGLLPTGYYSDFTRLLLPAGTNPTVDGRLREMLALPECRGACIPDQRWLNLTNTRYLITDKVADFWQNGVAYDTQFEATLEPGERFIRVIDETNFEANALDVLYKGDAPLRWQLQSGEIAGEPLPALDPAAAPGLDGYQLVRFQLEAPSTSLMPTLISESAAQIRAMTLVDTRVPEVFYQVALDPWRRVLSSDIKLYENQTVQTRAFLVSDVQTVTNDSDGTNAALVAMRDSAFDPLQTAIISSNDFIPEQPSAASQAIPQIVQYTAERVEIHVSAAEGNLLVLTDAYYPGWTATVNSEPAPIYRADLMFRGVKVPAGESTVVFEYRPWWMPGILIVGGVVWAGLGLVLVVLWRRATIKPSTNYSQGD